MEAQVEARLQDLEKRLRLVETLVSPSPALYVSPPVLAEAQPVLEEDEPARRAPPSFEDLVGGRILAWVGGSAVVLAVAFFLALAIDRGWIDEQTRVVLAFAGSTAFLAAGLWLYEHRGHTQAALAAVAAAIAGLFASDTAATAVYHLISAPAGLALAALIGGAAAAIAVRWDSRVVAGIGLGGALLAPVLVQAGATTASLAFMAVALVATVAILLWRRWAWLATVAFLVSLPQLGDWVLETRDAYPYRALAVIAGFWALHAACAVGYELRVPGSRLRVSSALILLANAAATASIGWSVLVHTDNVPGAKVWLGGLAAAHVVVGAWAMRGRVGNALGLVIVAIGAALAGCALAVVLDGPALVAGYAAAGAILALAARRANEPLGFAGAGTFLALAGGHALVFEAPPRALATGVDSLPQAVVAVGLAIACCAAVALAARGMLDEVTVGAGWAGAVLTLYLASVAVVDLAGASSATGVTQASQLLLSGLWTVAGVGVLVAGLVADRRPLRLGGLALLGLAVVKVFAVDLAALESVYRVASFLALGLLLLAGAFAYQQMRSEPRA
jgi:uncharacterized membrane protein